MMPTIKTWIQAARPKTLPFGLAPAFVGSALSFRLGQFSWITFLLCALSALFLQVGANFANDVFDFEKGADTVDRVGPIRAVASGSLSKGAMKRGLIVSFMLAFLFGFPIILKEGFWLSLIFSLVVLIAISYSKDPFAFAYHGLGEIINLVFMAGLPTLLMVYVQTHQWLFSSFCLGLCFGGLTSAVMCLNNLRDEVTDRRAQKRTLVVQLGQENGKRLFAFFLLYPFALPWILLLISQLPFKISLVTPLILPTIPLIKQVFTSQRSDEFSSVFSKTALLALVYALTLTYGLLV